MKYLKFIIFCLTCLIWTSCHEHEKEQKPGKSRRTVIIYMAAENSLASYTDSDMREMLTGISSIPLDCNLVVYMDDTTMPCIYTFGAQTGKELWETLPEQNSCDSLTFQKTLDKIIKDFPAEHYGLVMWSHGSGWIPSVSRAPQHNGPHKTIGIDNNFNSCSDMGSELDIPVMRRMLEKLGVHWDYIFFDACFMQCVEVDYELRNVCDYVIGSPAEIPGEGAPYHLIMSSLFADNDAAESICRTYYADNENIVYDYTFSKLYGGISISAAKTSEMPKLAETMKQYITKLFANKRQYDIDGVQTYCIYEHSTVWKPEYYDLGSAMNLLLASPADYQHLKAQLSQAYPIALCSPYWISKFYNRNQGIITDPEHVAAVSMFIPHQKYDQVHYNEHFKTFEWYHAAGWDQTGW